MRCRNLALALAAAYGIEATTMSVSAGDTKGISSTAGTLASNLLGYYNSADNGVLPQPYYWWESGGMWGGLIEYWHNTGDAQYNEIVASALASQAGVRDDFMGPNTQGNDDQAWWGLAAMSAAEYGLPPPSGGGPSWLILAQNVFASIHARWDTTSCNGGLKWQIFTSEPGYDYKNSIANGLFFQLGARLARFTGNADYAAMADTTFTWVQSVGLVDKDFNVYDGTDDTKGCTSLDHDQWSYNVGVFLYGSAVMSTLPGADPKWTANTNGLIGAVSTFLTDGKVLIESKCEKSNSCNTDQLSFKAYLSRWLAATAALVPSTQAQINPLLQASAAGAVASCSGGPGGDSCGAQWYTGAYDGATGVGQQLAALEVVHGLLAGGAAVPQRRMRRGFVA